MAANVGGYEHDFIEKVQEFECPLCLHVTREPSLTGCCGQHFCHSCISQVTTDREPCPLCKEENFTVLLDKKQNRRVLELKVSCTMKERGCDWTGELGHLTAHTDSDVQNSGGCQYVDVVCSNKCGESFQRRNIRVHLMKCCPNRQIVCKYCDYQDTYINVHDKHYPKCLQYPVPCPNNCGIVNVERSLMSAHLDECPKQLVECEFAHAGCTKFCRQDLKKHTEQSTQSHLSMVSSKLREMKTKLDERDEEVRELKISLDARDKEVRELKTRVAARDKEVRELKTRLDARDKEVRELKTRLDARDKEVRELKTRLDARDKEVRELKTRLDVRDKEVRELKTEKDKEVRELKTSLDARDKQVRELKTRLDARDKEVRELKTRLDAKDKEVRELKTRLDARDKEVRALKTEKDKEVRELTTRLAKKDEEIKTLQSQCALQ